MGKAPFHRLGNEWHPPQIWIFENLDLYFLSHVHIRQVWNIMVNTQTSEKLLTHECQTLGLWDRMGIPN